MGWRRFKRFIKKTGRVIKSTVEAPIKVTENIGKVATGKLELDDAIRTTLSIPVKVFATTADAVAELDREVQSISVRIATKVGGSKAKDIVADLNHVARMIADPALAVAALQSVDKFILTGDPEYLNPINIYTLRELQQTRDLLIDKAREIPTAVINALHPDVQKFANGVKWLLENDIPGNLTLPHFAIDHGNHQGAITLVDLIIFDRLPDYDNEDDLHFWSHEIFHTHQYRTLGVEKFTKQYLGEEMGFHAVGSSGNSLEIDADMFACRYYPNGTAHYLPGKVCPIRP